MRTVMLPFAARLVLCSLTDDYAGIVIIRLLIIDGGELCTYSLCCGSLWYLLGCSIENVGGGCGGVVFGRNQVVYICCLVHVVEVRLLLLLLYFLFGGCSVFLFLVFLCI